MTFKIEKIVLGNKDQYGVHSFVKEMIKHQGNTKCIGEGGFAQVYADASHDYVYKVAEDNAYLTFIEMLSKQTTHNPYFPVVHAARLIKERGYGRYLLVVCMEKLKPIPWNGVGFPQDIFELLCKTKPKSMKSFGKLMKLDPLFVSAVELLYKTFKDPKYEFDLHNENIMLRGDHIVFTDPVV